MNKRNRGAIEITFHFNEIKQSAHLLALNAECLL